MNANDMPAWMLSQWGVVVLLAARILGLAWTAPGLSTAGLGVRARLVMAVLVTACVAPGLREELAPSGNLSEFARLLLIEIAVGATLGVSAGLIVAAARQGGELVGVQAGLSASTLLEPDASGEMTPMGHLYGMLALGVFVAMDGPLQLVESVMESYRTIPIGGWALSESTVNSLFSQVGAALGLALRASAPATLALMIAGLALGLMARTAASFQFMNLSLAVRAAAGFVIVLVGLSPLVAMLMTAWRLAL